MILLCVDTSGVQGSIALARLDGARVISQRQVIWTKKAMHSEIATVQLGQLLKDSNIGLEELTHLAVNVGPGSFTGLRVGISLVKTLAFALKLPVAEVNSLESLAFTQTQPGESSFIAIKAIQNFLYAAAFKKSESGLSTTLSPRSISISDVPTLTKNYTKVLIEGQSPGFTSETEAQDLIPIFVQSRLSGPFSEWKAVEPLYIRASEAEEKLRRGLLRPI